MARAPRPSQPSAMDDPLLSAVVSKLPPAGQPWDHAGRESWFEMMRKAVDVAYGPLSPSGTRVGGYPPGSVVTADLMSHSTTPSPKLLYVVAPDGSALAGDRPIDPADIPSGTVLHDYRPQPVDPDYSPIMWKTHGAKPMPLPPGVLLRPATEPWAPKGLSNGSAEATG